REAIGEIQKRCEDSRRHTAPPPPSRQGSSRAALSRRRDSCRLASVMTQSVNDPPAYEGLRVVDLSQGVAGPHCGMLFALHGADVVKVEPPDGDWGRSIGKRHGDWSAYAIAFNRGKRSLAIDLKQPEGREVVAQLVARADVVIENNRPGVLARFKLDYEQVRASNPEVVYVSVTG